MTTEQYANVLSALDAQLWDDRECETLIAANGLVPWTSRRKLRELVRSQLIYETPGRHPESGERDAIAYWASGTWKEIGRRFLGGLSREMTRRRALRYAAERRASEALDRRARASPMEAIDRAIASARSVVRVCTDCGADPHEGAAYCRRCGA